jgi:hypothetical protein
MPTRPATAPEAAPSIDLALGDLLGSDQASTAAAVARRC